MTSRTSAIPFLLALFVFGACLPGAAGADSRLEVWRSEMAAARLLAENDIPGAYLEAQRLRAALPAGVTPADQARMLNLLARIELYAAQTELAAGHIQQALDIATRNADRGGQVEADLNLALNAVNQAKIDDMVAAVNHSMTVLDGVDRPDLLGEAMLRTSMMYRRLGQFDDSVKMSMQAMEIAKRSNNPLALTFAHQGLAIAFSQSARNAEAHEHYEKMRDQARAARSKLLEADALLGMGWTASATGDVDGGDRLIRQAIALYRTAGGPFYVAHGLYALAYSLRQQGRYAESLPLLDEIAATYEQYSNKIGFWWTLDARSSNLQALGRLDASWRDAERAHALAKDIGLSLYLGESAQRMAAIAAARGDHRKAYELSVEAADMKARTEQEKNSGRIAELAQRYESESKQRKIQELTRRNQLQAAQQRWLWTVLGGSIAMLAGTAIFLLRLRRSNRLLEAANTQLRRARNDQQAILNAIPDLLFEMGLDGRYHDCYCSRLDLLAVPVADLIGNTVSDVLPPEAADTCISALREAYARGMSSGRQYEMSFPHGRIWFELSVSLKSMGPGQEPRFVVLSRDITARKRAEEQLWMMDFAMNHVREAAYIIDAQMRFLYANEESCRALGYGRDELLGMTVLDIDPDARPEALAELTKNTNREGFLTFERRHRGKDGRIFPVEIFSATFEYSGQSVAILLARDITERKRAEELLYAREQQYRTLAENAPDIIIRYDHDCRRIYVNRAYEEEAALAGDVLNVNSDVRWQTDVTMPIDEYRAHLRGVMETGEPADIVVGWPRWDGTGKAGEIRYHALRIVAERDPEGRVTGTLAMGHNITALKEAENQLEESHAQLRELITRREAAREEERKRIAREVHDELGQILMGLRLEITVAAHQAAKWDAHLADNIRGVLDTVDNVSQVVRNMVTTLRPPALDMGLGAALEWLTDEFTARSGINCETSLETFNIRLEEDRSMAIFRIVQESLTNVARHAVACNMTITLEQHGESLVVTVRDDGKGFDPGAIDTQSFGLLGMKERALAVGGEVVVTSAPGCGTVVEVNIPVASRGINEPRADCR